MAGAVILGSGWASFSAGATAGSLAHSAFGNSSLMEPKTIVPVAVPALAVNHIKAYKHKQKMRSEGNLDSSGFPIGPYCQNLAIIGFVASTLMTRRFGMGWKSGLGVLVMLISPLPVTGPLCFLYILLI